MRHLLLKVRTSLNHESAEPDKPRLVLMGLLLSFGWVFAASPVRAAERVYISYGVLERSIPVGSLETYARTGMIDEDLAVYAAYAKPAALKQLQTVLTAKADLSPVAVSQFLYSPQGELVLRRLGDVIQSESRLSGFNAIRAALILASADPEGLSLLNVLRKFPTRGLRIDVEQSLTIVNSLERAVNQTKRATDAVTQEAALEIGAELNIGVEQLADLRLRGPFTWQKQTVNLLDTSRQAASGSSLPSIIQDPAVALGLTGRVIPVDLYLPTEGQSQLAKTLPVVVISHGLGSDRGTFSYLAQHLASYGFAVLVPEHPGSNAKQIQALLNGIANEIAEPREFVDRPLDITFLLNQVEQRAASDPTLQGRLDLQNVGIIGQSFGGYTSLVLGGAPVNFQQLRADCENLSNTFNLSLLLQCRALQLGQIDPNLRDDRIKAVIAINPVTSAVFGRSSISQIKVPTMLVAGSADTVAPALIEQFQPFTWLTIENKYLVLMAQGTHFSTLGAPNDTSNSLPIPAEVVGPNPAIARRYMTALATAFMQVYLANQPAYRPYLSASYAQSIEEPSIPLSLVRRLTAEQLANVGKESTATVAQVARP